MADPQTQPIPTDNQQTPQTPSQEWDFFGGGEEAFQEGKVFDPNAPVVPEAAPAYTPNQPVWEPTLPEENVEPISKPEPEIKPVQEIEKPTPEPKVEQIPTPVAVQEKEPLAIPANISDLGKKVIELFTLTKTIYQLKKSEDAFDLLGADNDKIRTVYKFFVWDEEYPLVSVTKIETDKENGEETLHELSFYLNETNTFININLDEELLFDEEADLQDDIKTKMQVTEKINKFIFLLTEEQKKLEKEIKARDAELEEKRKLQDVFRNF